MSTPVLLVNLPFEDTCRPERPCAIDVGIVNVGLAVVVPSLHN